MLRGDLRTIVVYWAMLLALSAFAVASTTTGPESERAPSGSGWAASGGYAVGGIAVGAGVAGIGYGVQRALDLDAGMTLPFGVVGFTAGAIPGALLAHKLAGGRRSTPLLYTVAVINTVSLTGIAVGAYALPPSEGLGVGAASWALMSFGGILGAGLAAARWHDKERIDLGALDPAGRPGARLTIGF